MNIYVGNLSYSATEDSLKAAFAEYGEVLSVKIIKDQFTGKSRGFAFVEMGTQEAGLKAIEKLNGKDFEGRMLKANEARPREERPRDSRPPRNNYNRQF